MIAQLLRIVLATEIRRSECCHATNQNLLTPILQNAKIKLTYTPNKPPVEGVIKCDMMWQKRGSGRAYKSMTGVGTIVGDETKKIIAYDIKNKDCRYCSVAAAKGTNVRKHNCQESWSGSSMGMELTAACDMMVNLEKAGLHVNTLIMDEDSTTISRLQKVFLHSITK